MATAKKTAKKAKPAPTMKASFDLFVYRASNGNSYYDSDRIHIFAEDPGGNSVAEIDSKGGVKITTSKIDTSLSVKSYCVELIQQLKLGNLPKNQLIRWSITAAPVVTDKSALKAALLAAAEKV